MLPLTRGTAAAGWQRHRALVICAAGKKAPGGSGSSSSKGSSSKKAPGSPWASPSGSKKAKDSSKGGRSPPKPAAKRPAAKAAKPGGGGFGKVSPPPAPPPPEVQKLTGPLVTLLLDELSPWEPAAAPLWPTWCGHSEGEWLGQYGAYTPWAGDPEPVWVDEGGAYLLYAFSRASAWREPGHPQGDMLLRATRRGDSITRLAAGSGTSSSSSSSMLAAEAGQLAAAAGGGAGVEEEDVEGFGYNRDGCVVFDGGAYSTGPVYMGYEEEEEEEEAGQQPSSSSNGYNPADGILPESALSFLGGEGEFEEGEEEGGPAAATFLLEQVLSLAGQERRRFVLTLKVKASPGEELGVEVARLLVAKEHWAGAAGEAAAANTGSSSGVSTSTASSSDSSSSSQAQHAGDVVNIPGTVRLPGDTPDTAAATTTDPDTTTTTSSSSSPTSTTSTRPPSGPLKLRAAERWDVPVIELPRPQPGEVGGVWNCWVTEAVPLEEEDPVTLSQREVWVYSAREERQQWRVAEEEGPPSGSAAADQGEEEEQGEEEGEGEAGAYVEADGGTFWLPGRCAVTVRMVPAAAATAKQSSSSSSSGPRGLLVSCCWVHGPGQALVMEREYDGEGGLVGVRAVSAVKGGWAGGRM